MKRLFLLPAILFLSHYLNAQKSIGRVCFLGEDVRPADWPCILEKQTKEDTIAEITLNSLLRPIGLHAQFIMKECTEIQNFAAIIDEKSQARYILYNRSMIDSIKDPQNRHWDIIAIYLHELSHHLSGNTSNPNDPNSIQQELYADEFAGTQIAKLQAKLAQAEGFLSLVENPSCDDDLDYAHPCLEKRLRAVEKGWYLGMGLEKFYESTISKKFSRSISDERNEKDNYLVPGSFFEYKHRIRSGKPCDCNVVVKELSLQVDFIKMTALLKLKLSEEYDYDDTTFIINADFEKLEQFLPGQKVSIDFVVYWKDEYVQGLEFTGILSGDGKISGDLISPNFHGASWVADNSIQVNQPIAKITLLSL